MAPAAGKTLLVRSGAEHYALDMTAVQEVVYHPDLTMLPQPKGFITGMCWWRNKQVPVVDLGLFLGKPAPVTSGDIVITNVFGVEAGFLVDEIGTIVDVPVDSLITVDTSLARQEGKVLQAFERQGELVFIIETKALAIR
ncbi:MAG: chemotaxis protein CheW [Deltaproteobacteria bacterium]|nr:chemotaxis protein CheW [Deltaproteobacteria bacterium]